MQLPATEHFWGFIPSPDGLGEVDRGDITQSGDEDIGQVLSCAIDVQGTTEAPGSGIEQIQPV
ncbi:MULTISPECIES: hypothetical protein [unclassified Frankia]|uniref:hypothetical protein n=1 Tax=unclassified Frankia TaxID=2632575 RepID=UPI002023BE9C